MKKTICWASLRSVALRLVILFPLSCLSAAALHGGQNTPAAKPRLSFAVIFTRHGVRSPIRRVEELNAYSREPWPVWDVPSGALTPRGRRLMELFGSYYRGYFSANGLLPSAGCEGEDRVLIRTDVDARTQDTGRALASGMMPGCNIELDIVSGKKDPLFSPLAARIGEPDHRLAVASIAGRIGDNPSALIAKYRPAFDTLREVLFGCSPSSSCPAEKRPGKRSILEQPSHIEETKGGHAADVQGPLKIGSSLSETLLLEYANGIQGKELGWGRLTRAKLLEIMSIHAAYADLARQTPYIARIQASNLLSHIIRSMRQAVSSAPVNGSLGKPGDRVLVIVGHDTNISNIAGVLGISWLLDGYQPDETPPGGALVFELWREPGDEFVVRTYFIAQSLDQMRKMRPVSLVSPPEESPIFVPNCSRGDQKMTCTWEGFQHTVESTVDPEFVEH
jgi:4-phytase / acid phosphatase